MGIEVKLAFDLLAFISVMVLIVLGLGIIASTMGIFNFAHGEFVLLGAYTVYIFESSGLSAWAGVLAAPIVLAIVGLALERLIIRRFYAVPIIAMLGTYAIGLVIREIVRGLLGGHYKSISEPLPGVFTLFGVDFSAWRAFIVLTTVCIIAATWLFLSRTSVGLQVRGSLENPNLARACGISTSKLYAYTFAFGAALAGLAAGAARRGGGRVAAGGGAAGGGGWRGGPTPACAADPVKMGIATDITGAIAPSGNANWQVAQFTVEQINKAGGIGGRQIELYLEETASDPKIAVGHVRKLIQERKVNDVLGGITPALRQPVTGPIGNRGRTL